MRLVASVLLTFVSFYGVCASTSLPSSSPSSQANSQSNFQSDTASTDQAQQYTFQPSRFDVSTFGRIVAGRIDDPDMAYFFYDDEWKFDSQSLAGLRLDAQFTDKLSAVVQGVAYAGDTRDSGVTQYYLNYQPTYSTNIRVGRISNNIFALSDSYDIGFSYPWITPPQQVYSDFLFFDVDGVMLNYAFGNADISGDIDIHLGQFSKDFVIANQTSYADGKHAQTIALNLYKGAMTYRVSYVNTNIEIRDNEVTELNAILNSIGYDSVADQLTTAGNLKLMQASVGYDDLSYFARAEWTKVKTDIYIMPKIESAYATVGLNFHPYSVSATLAWSDFYYPPLSNSIPLGLAPQLDELSSLVRTFNEVLDDDSLVSLSLGARYDYNAHIALKAEITLLNGKDGKRGYFNVVSDNNLAREATLFQVALEWAF